MPVAPLPPCVLLGGGANALSVARTLWRAGVAVDVLAGADPTTPTRRSRAVRRCSVTCDATDTTASWLEWLGKAEPSVVLACSDAGLELIARHRSDLMAAGHRPAESDDRVVLAMLDKSRTYAMARDVGVPAPRTAVIAEPADLPLLQTFTFPCAVKPVSSHLFTRRFRHSAKGARVEDAAQARTVLEPILAEGISMLLTEVVEGSDECCSYYGYLDQQGEPLARFTKRKLRTYPNHFGLGTYHLTEWMPEVAELGQRFLGGVGLLGMGNVEFKRDRRDGVLKLIECNPRFTLAQEQVRRAGVDFGRLAYSRAASVELPCPLGPERDGIGLWFPADDVKALAGYRRSGEVTATAWLATLARPQVFALWTPADPVPSLVNGWRQAKSLRRAAGRALGVGTGRGRRPPVENDPYRPPTAAALSRR